MELKQIKELMAAMERMGIKKLNIKETTGFELQLERQEDGSSSPPVPHSYPAIHPHHPMRELEHHHHFPSQAPGHKPHTPEPAHEKREEKEAGKYVVSPMVGTFYLSPSPDDPAFVKVGDRVDENSVVCIIEAMKVMNEVKAGMSGVIAEVCADSGHPVEFGTKIFRIV